jgi:hypothetical protein
MSKAAHKSVTMHFSLCGLVQEIAYIQKSESKAHVPVNGGVHLFF